MNNEQILMGEYVEFYKKHYDIITPHIDAVKSIIKIKSYITKKNCKILEYGCATGFNLRYLQNEGYKNLTGIDGYKEFIDEALTKEDNINYQYNNFNKETSEITEEKYDFIFTRGTLQQNKNIKNSKIKNTDDDVKSIFYNFYNMLNLNGLVVICEGAVRDWIKLTASVNLARVDVAIKFKNIYIFRKI